MAYVPNMSAFVTLCSWTPTPNFLIDGRHGAYLSHPGSQLTLYYAFLLFAQRVSHHQILLSRSGSHHLPLPPLDVVHFIRVVWPAEHQRNAPRTQSLHTYQCAFARPAHGRRFSISSSDCRPK